MSTEKKTVLEKTLAETQIKAEEDPLIGQVIGGCKILSLVGKGAMGSVYKAIQLSLDRLVAFKTIRPEFCTDEQFLQRFQQEARTVGRFNTAHIVQIHEVGKSNNLHYLIMEFVGGGSLWNFAGSKPQRRLPTNDAIRFLAQAVEGLMEAERLQIVHRDIKPENLLLDSQGRLKIADFGIAKILDSGVELTMSASVVGTPLYMSPEQALGKSLDARSDMYSLGASIYHLLTGVPPVQGDSVYDCIRKKTEIDCLSPARILMDQSIPAPLSGVIEKMTAQNPKDRYATFSEILAELERIRRGDKPAVEIAAARKRLALVASVVGVVVLGATGFWIFSGGKSNKTPTQMPRTVQSLPSSQKATPKLEPEIQKPEAKQEAKPEIKLSEEPQKNATADKTETVLLANAEFEKTTPAKTEDTAIDNVVQKSEPSNPAPAELTAVNIPETKTENLFLSVEQSLEEIRRIRLRMEGTPDIVLSDAQSLRKKIDSSLPQAQELERTIEGLIADAREKERIINRLSARNAAVSLPNPQDPSFYPSLLAELQKTQELMSTPESIGPELKAWLQSEWKSRAKDLEDLAITASPLQLSRIDRGLDGFAKHELGIPALQALLAEFEKNRKALFDAFGDSKEKWEKILPAEKLNLIRERIATREKQETELRHLNEEMDRVKAKIQSVKGATQWIPELEAELSAQLAQIIKSQTSLRAQDSLLAMEDLDTKILSSQKIAQSWNERRKIFTSALEQIQSRQLAAAASSLSSLSKDSIADTDAQTLASVRNDVAQAFVLLFDKLDLDQAESNFRRAKKDLESLKYSAHFLESCLQRIEQLRTATKGMAAVLSGQVRIGKEDSKVVESFFLDCGEVTVKDYRSFLKNVSSRLKPEEIHELWPDEENLEPPYLKEAPNTDSSWPVEEVNYYQAIAYLKALSKDLPSLDEWWIAAKGAARSGEHRKFPWVGESFANARASDVNKSSEKPVPVTKGGTTIGFSSPSVHHLAGNVAEWIKMRKPDSKTAALVGGRYLDQEEGYFSGERLDYLDPRESGPGYGFRGVIRPKEFFADLLPQ